MRRFILAAGLSILAATFAKAEVVTYDCTLRLMEQGWISERVILSVDAENKRGRVYDSYIHHLDRRPKEVNFKKLRNGKYRLTWKIRILAETGGTVLVSYTAKLDPNKRRLDLIARFPQVNALNRPSGYGGCSVNSTRSLYAE